MEKKKFNKLVKSIKQAGKIKRGEPLEDDLPYKPVAHDHEAFLKKAMKRKDFRGSYEGLEGEYRLAREMLTARSRLGLTQEDVAGLMGTTKSAVSRLEATGKHTPSLTFPPGSHWEAYPFSDFPQEIRPGGRLPVGNQTGPETG